MEPGRQQFSASGKTQADAQLLDDGTLSVTGVQFDKIATSINLWRPSEELDDHRRPIVVSIISREALSQCERTLGWLKVKILNIQEEELFGVPIGTPCSQTWHMMIISCLCGGLALKIRMILTYSIL
jgi:hypothetical protein